MFAALPSDERALAIAAGALHMAAVEAVRERQLCSACTAQEALSNGFCYRCTQARGLDPVRPVGRAQSRLGRPGPTERPITDDEIDELLELIGRQALTEPTCPACRRSVPSFTSEPCARCRTETAAERRERELAGKLRWWTAHGNEWRRARRGPSLSNVTADGHPAA